MSWRDRSTADYMGDRWIAEQDGYRLKISTAPGTLTGRPVRHHSSRELPEGPGLVVNLVLLCRGTFKRIGTRAPDCAVLPHLLWRPARSAAGIKVGEGGQSRGSKRPRRSRRKSTSARATAVRVLPGFRCASLAIAPRFTITY